MDQRLIFPEGWDKAAATQHPGDCLGSGGEWVMCPPRRQPALPACPACHQPPALISPGSHAQDWAKPTAIQTPACRAN